MSYDYYLEVIRNYENLLDQGYAELDVLQFLYELLPVETTLLFTQGYFQVSNN